VRSVVRFTTVLVLVLSLGLHWAVLQTIAWTGMIVSYSRDASFSEAVSKTFDGEHPCPMCKVIKQARAEEKQQQEKQQVESGSKMDLELVWQSTAFDFSCDREKFSSPDFSAPSRREQPPKPRPRIASCDSLA
jgi:hypothetical protein